MLAITKKLISYNFSSRNKQAILYIVIHDTGNPRAGADAEAHYRYFNGGNRGASAHYFVDASSIIQTVEDYNASWHCGDGQGKYGITNQNSVGVEICINADGDDETKRPHSFHCGAPFLGYRNIPSSTLTSASNRLASSMQKPL
jgi:N-acetylmuramoyl-L-alanine amidase